MGKNIQQIRYPERIRERFLASGDLILGDGSRISTAEMWRYVTEEAPRRFPAAFTVDRFDEHRLPDFDFMTGIKRRYWHMTGADRFKKRIASGRRVVTAQVGTPREIYTAAGCMVVEPRFPVEWQMRQLEGLSREERAERHSAISNECKKCMPAECCTIVAPFAAAKTTKTPIDFVSLVTMTWCSDGVYTMESAQRQGQNIPWHMVDFPVQSHAGKWRVEYLAKQFRRLAARLNELTGKAVTDGLLAAEIRRRNEMRRLARESLEMWLAAPTPPTSGGGFMAGGDPEDYPVAKQLMLEAKAEMQWRIANNIRPPYLDPNPVRLFICGSCAQINGGMVERNGGVIVGQEIQFCGLYLDVKEEGDPFLNLAEAACNHPYELPPEQRAKWTAQKIKETRADGALFIYNWGCNYQSSISRMITDIIRAEAGVPTLILDVSRSGRAISSGQIRTRVEAFMEILKQNRSTGRSLARAEEDFSAEGRTSSCLSCRP